MRLCFRVIEDDDPAADCKPEWFALASWLPKRWGFYRTQQADYFFLGFCYLAWN